jgi:Tol biopolymer transport system component/DNA-binding winged helix-turn-helix (wHTH) protein
MSGGTRPAYEFGPFRLDLSEHQLLRDGVPVPLTPKTFELLRVLVQHAGHLVQKDTLLQEVWPDNFVEEGALNRSISVIRKLLGESIGREYIETVPKRGYRFVMPVRERFDDVRVRTVDQDHDRSSAGRAEFAEGRFVPGTGRRFFGPPAGLVALFLMVIVVAVAMVLVQLGRQRAPQATADPTHRQVTFTGREGAPTLSPDGRRIAYVSNDSPERKVIVQELAGGSPLKIFSAPEAGHLRWSPDGTELLVWTRGAGRSGVFIISQMGGAPRLVAPEMYIGCWSPDGSTIAVAGFSRGQIWLMDRQGAHQRTLSTPDVSGAIWDIDWSGPAGLLAFTSSESHGRFTLWTIRPDGTELTRIVTGQTPIYSARWAPAGDALYYLRHVNQTAALHKIAIPSDRSPETEAAALLSGLEADQSFALSDDGKRLVYARASYYSNLWMLDLGVDGRSATTELTRGTAIIERPHISPDGQSIAFNVGHEPTANVYTMPINGGAPTQLTYFDAFTVTGGWSADGGTIAVASNQGGKARVWTVSANGGPPHALSSGDMSDNFSVSWFPGRDILYQRAGNQDFYQLDPETAAEHPLAADSSVGWIFSPASSPDGTKLAVMWSRRPSHGVWVIDNRNHHERFVYPSGEQDIVPIGWSEDGSAIYALAGKYLELRGNTLPLGETLTDARIMRIPLQGEPTMIAAVPSHEIGSMSMTVDARRFVYTAYTSRSDVWVVDNFDVTPVQRVSRK